MQRVLFVCYGNTCRSPMAEGLLRRMINERCPEFTGSIIVESAGMGAWEGDRASEKAVQVMQEIGVDLSGHRARRVNKDMISQADLIITVERHHCQELVEKYNEHRARITTLAELAGLEYRDISDPFGKDVEAYRKCRDELQEMLEHAWKRIRDRLDKVSGPGETGTEEITE